MSAIKCFRCSSDQANGEFCKDPFNMDLISDQARRWTFVECADPPGRLDSHDHSLDTISVCIKYKQLSKPQCQYVFRVFYNFFVFFCSKRKGGSFTIMLLAKTKRTKQSMCHYRPIASTYRNAILLFLFN